MRFSLSFWETITGQVLRWIILVPIGLLLASIIEALLVFLYTWISGMSTGWIVGIIGLFGFSGVFLLALMFYMGKITGDLAPNKTVALVIMSAFMAMNVYKTFTIYSSTHEETMPFEVFVPFKIVMAALFLWGIVKSHQ